MNNHLQLCRILLLQIHGKLKPISILSPSQRNLSRGCSCSPALLAVPCLAAPGAVSHSRQCLPWARLPEPPSWAGGRKVGCWAVIRLGRGGCWARTHQPGAASTSQGGTGDAGGFESPWEGRLQVPCGPWPSGTQICSLCKCQSNKTYWKSHPKMPASLQRSLYRSCSQSGRTFTAISRCWWLPL